MNLERKEMKELGYIYEEWFLTSGSSHFLASNKIKHFFEVYVFQSNISNVGLSVMLENI